MVRPLPVIAVFTFNFATLPDALHATLAERLKMCSAAKEGADAHNAKTQKLISFFITSPCCNERAWRISANIQKNVLHLRC
jgi:hypothetical protein